MTPESVLSCRGVTKAYGKHVALSGFDLDISRGEVVGLIGPNGAGKTTLIKVLLGLATPASGSISVFGRDLYSSRAEIVRHVGAVIEAPIFFEYLSAYLNLYHLVSLSGRTDRGAILEALEGVGLGAVSGKKVGTFSYGMKQRLGIAQALLPDTHLLILDEPTNGLDPHGIAGMRDLIRRLARERRITVLVSSHLLGEIEQICDRVVIVHHGRKLMELDVGSGLQPRGAVEVEIEAHPEVAAAEVEGQGAEAVAGADPGRLVLRYGGDCAVPVVVRRLVEAGAAVHRVSDVRETLEDIFIRHTGGSDGDVRIDAF